MPIYVDDANIPAVVGKLNTTWCHLVCMPFDIHELEAFGAKIGLKPQWIHHSRSCSHYDVTPGKKIQAKIAGAIEMDAGMLSRLIHGDSTQLCHGQKRVVVE